ncbi:MAG: TetR/AcrR family transcriptional regulator C-terminal domain-containing protein, partial [Streptosporangiaceae bacterium]
QHTATVPALTDGLSWDQVLRDYAQTLRATLLAHPGVLPLFFTRPAATPQTLKTVEDGLRVLTGAGFALPRALDMINVLSIFVVGHAMAEAGTAELTRRGDPGSAAALAQLDASDLPLVIEAARLAQGPDDETRFLFGLDALLCGFARWQEPQHIAAK